MTYIEGAGRGQLFGVVMREEYYVDVCVRACGGIS